MSKKQKLSECLIHVLKNGALTKRKGLKVDVKDCVTLAELVESLTTGKLAGVNFRGAITRLRSMPRITKEDKVAYNNYKLKTLLAYRVGYNDKGFNGLIPIDEENGEITIDKKHIVLRCKSSGGAGNFVLVRTQTPKSEKEYFNIANYIQSRYGVASNERQTNPDRCRYVTLDPEYYFNQDAEPYVVELNKIIAPKAEPSAGYTLYKQAKEGKIKLNNGTALAVYAHLSSTLSAEKIVEEMESLEFDSHSLATPQARAEYYDKWDARFGADWHKNKEQHEVKAAVVRQESSADLIVNPKLSAQYNQMVTTEWAAQHGHIASEFGEFYKWTGTHYEHKKSKDLINSFADMLYDMGLDAAKTYPFLRGLEDTFRYRLHREVTSNLGVLNLQNKVIVFNEKSGEVEIREHSPDYFCLYVLPYSYNPNAKSTITQKVLDKIIPDKTIQLVLWEYIASAFLKDTKFEQMLFLVGSGANGKSTIFNMIKFIFGGAFSAVDLTRLTDSRGDAAALEAQNIHNKLIAADSDSRGITDADVWKKIVSREEVNVKSLYSQPFKSTNYARIMVGMNNVPVIQSTHGAVRRLVVIPMTTRIEESEQDRQLDLKIQKDASWVLNQIILGWKRLVKQKGELTRSGVIEAATKEVSAQSDIVEQWLKDNEIESAYEPTPRTTKQSKIALYEAKKKAGKKILLISPTLLYREPKASDGINNISFIAWMRERNYRVITYTTFRQRLDQKGFEEEEFKEFKNQRRRLAIWVTEKIFSELKSLVYE